MRIVQKTIWKTKNPIRKFINQRTPIVIPAGVQIDIQIIGLFGMVRIFDWDGITEGELALIKKHKIYISVNDVMLVKDSVTFKDRIKTFLRRFL